MARGKPIRVAAIITLDQEGFARRQIEKILNISKSTVKYTIRRFRDASKLKNHTPHGPSKVTTLAEIGNEFNREQQHPMFVYTVKRRPQKGNLHR